MRAILALEDGQVFEGEAFGASRTVTGEIVFNTSMTGYQEVLSDPSYRGEIVAMTYPLIGNYGINRLDMESDRPHLCAFIIEELSPVVSNWRADCTLEEYLKEWDIPGVQGIDTRTLTLHLRQRGTMRACVTSDPKITPEEAVALAKGGSTVDGVDLVKEVTTRKPYEWDPDGKLSRKWTIVKGDGTGILRDERGEAYEEVPPVKYHIVAYDFGVKLNILRKLRQAGLKVTVVPATTPASEVLALNPDGIFLSNGPGDPAALGYIHKEVKQLLGKKPIFGICLGHQILSHAFGGATSKLKFGHRGGNQPVKDLKSGRVAITAQNHGFAVVAESLPPEVEVTHISLNDETVEGMRHKTLPVFSVQFHPEAAPGPHDAENYFLEFVRLIEANRRGL